MKKIIIILLFIFLIIASGCDITFTTNEKDSETEPNTNTSTNENHENEVTEEEITTMYLYINDNKIKVDLYQNKATSSLIEKLKEGDITYTARDYGGFEKVGALPFALPTENKQISTSAGDVILYSGNQIVIFYGTNSWSYTRLGKINGKSVNELKEFLDVGNNNTQITISLD